jgi:hypothetical protein
LAVEKHLLSFLFYAHTYFDKRARAWRTEMIGGVFPLLLLEEEHDAPPAMKQFLWELLIFSSIPRNINHYHIRY